MVHSQAAVWLQIWIKGIRELNEPLFDYLVFSRKLIPGGCQVSSLNRDVTWESGLNRRRKLCLSSVDRTWLGHCELGHFSKRDWLKRPWRWKLFAEEKSPTSKP